MFIAIAQFPKIKQGEEAAFLQWFAWSNEEFSKFPGFIRRRLLKSLEGEKYTALIEFESFDEFNAVGKSPFHTVSAKRVSQLLEGNPVPNAYLEIMG